MPGDWLTYAEAAKRLGIKPESVKKRAIRRGWPRQTGNDGLARIRLPDDLPAPHVSGPISSPAAPDTTGDSEIREKLAAAETEIRLLRERLTDLDADRQNWQQIARRLSEPRPIRPGGILSRLFGRD